MIGVGTLCLIMAVVEKFTGVHYLKVSPVNLVHSASALFLLALAVMHHGRCYCCKEEEKK
jgi:hypothetical protein